MLRDTPQLPAFCSAGPPHNTRPATAVGLSLDKRKSQGP
jgi:hypothetical protein